MSARAVACGLVACALGCCVAGLDTASASRAVNGSGLGARPQPVTPDAGPPDAGAPDAGPIDAGPPVAPFALNGILSTGQSLSNGATATPTSTTQPYSNVMLADTLVTWAATTAYAAHAWVSPGTDYVYTATSSCTSGAGPSWSTTPGGTTTDGSCTWTTDHLAHEANPVTNEPWTSGGTYAATFNGNIFLHPASDACIHVLAAGAGPSGTTQPSPWSHTIGNYDPTDGAYTWKCFWLQYGWFDLTQPTAGSLALVPYVEPPRPTQWQLMYPHNIQGETPTAALLNSVTALSIASGVPGWVLSGTDTGMGGQGMSVIDKGGTGNAYAAGLYEMRAIKALANAQGKSFGVVATVLTHGEADQLNASYATQALALQAAYQTDIQAITGQSRAIPMIASQQSTSPCMPSPWSTADLPISAYQLLLAHNTAPLGRIVVSGPKYALPRNSNDQHMPAAGYRELGEKYAEVEWALARGTAWRPLQPLGGAQNAGAYTASTSSTTVTIALDVAFPPLVFDTSTVPLNHQSTYTEWANGMGLEAWDSVGHLTISTVSISGTSLVLTLATTPHTGLVVAYASTSDATTAGAGCYGGEPGGHYGNVRDSDPFVGPITSVAQPNWLVIFESPALT